MRYQRNVHATRPAAEATNDNIHLKTADTAPHA